MWLTIRWWLVSEILCCYHIMLLNHMVRHFAVRPLLITNLVYEFQTSGEKLHRLTIVLSHYIHNTIHSGISLMEILNKIYKSDKVVPFFFLVAIIWLKPVV